MNLRPLALISVFALVLPACSGDDGETGASTTNATNTTNTTNTTATTSTSGSTSETSGGSGSGSEGSTSGGSSTTDPSTSGSSTGDPSTTGTTADPTTGTSTGGTTGGVGDPYDPETCAGDPLGVQGIEGAFCSAECTMNADCPMGPPGTMGMCVLSTMGNMTPTNCALICQLDNDACPEGSTCKDIMQMGAGICTYP